MKAEQNAMAEKALSPHPQEIELKLALLASNPAELEKTLDRMLGLEHRKPGQLHLHNTYYDTPDQTLRRKHVALRLRRVDSDAKPAWLQTLKIGGSGDSALSQRGEWETSVPGGELALAALRLTPWADMDPDNDLFCKVAPRFVTRFDRTSWSVRKPNGSIVEVSFDVGEIVVAHKRTPVCELELELQSGPPSALFEVAHKLTRSIAVMPETRSKAERAYLIAEDLMSQPCRAQPPSLTAKMKATEAAQNVLREMFGQFTSNLLTLHHADDPEVLHQVRVGWRRFKSAVWLFKPILHADQVPAWAPLKPLLTLVGELRDLDVARTETLPQFKDAYVAGEASRSEKWRALNQSLNQSASVQHQAVCRELDRPHVGAVLVQITQWLESLHPGGRSGDSQDAQNMSLRRLARRRLRRLHRQLKGALQEADTPDGQHQARVLAKQTRYGIEAVKPLLNRKRSKRWYQEATDLQTRIGTARDVVQTNLLMVKVGADQALTEFLRGVAVGQKM